MWKVLEIVLYVTGPLVWGLAVEAVFEKFRRRRARAGKQPEVSPFDWVI